MTSLPLDAAPGDPCTVDVGPRKRRRRWRILPPIALGIGVIVLMAQGRQAPEPAEVGEGVRPVHVLEARALSLRPAAEGHGPVRPARVWMAVAEVSRRIVEIHPRLREGGILPAGTELLCIDPIDYEPALAEVQAELAATEALADLGGAPWSPGLPATGPRPTCSWPPS
jgi:hypothetical protein